MTPDTTTIAIMRDDWQRLNARKEEPGESLADVFNRVLDDLEAAEKEGFVPDDREDGPRVDPDDFDTFADIEARADEEGHRDAREDVREAVEAMDLPGGGKTLSERQKALVDCYEHLRLEGSAKKSEFFDIIDGFDHGYASTDSYWSNVVKGKNTLQSLPGVEPPAEGMSTWRFEP
jgi:hypothetical protein